MESILKLLTEFVAVGYAFNKGFERVQAGVQSIKAVSQAELLYVDVLVYIQLVNVFVKHSFELGDVQKVLQYIQPVVKNLFIGRELSEYPLGVKRVFGAYKPR